MAMVKIADLNPILESLDRAQQVGDLTKVSHALRDSLGIDHVFYHWAGAGGEHYGCGTYPKAWRDCYRAQGYSRNDPVRQACYQSFDPVDWSQLDWSSKAARAVRADRHTHGIGPQGFSIPIRGPQGQFAYVTCNDSCSERAWQSFVARHERDLILIAHLFHHKALAFKAPRAGRTVRTLSPRETDAMTLIAQGLNRAQIAHSLSISEHTLRVYIESARFKLGALNTTHAVACALTQGLIVV